MITTDQVAGPPTPHAVKVVDTSRSVNRESHFRANMVNAHVNSSRSAKADSTHAFMAVLPDGRTVMVAPAPPALPQQIIPAHFPWPAADMARPINTMLN